MPGRQYRAPVSVQKRPNSKKKTQKRFLNAFVIAEHENPERVKIRKSRLGETEDDGSGRRSGYDSEDGSGGEDDSGPPTKRLRSGDKDRFGNEIEAGSDSEGNEWITGGVKSDDDSSIDSDMALGESDEDFASLKPRASKKVSSRARRVEGEDGTNEDDLDEDISLNEETDHQSDSDSESEGFAAEAIDLAAALDERDSDSDTEGRPPTRLKQNSSTFEGFDNDEESILSFSDDNEEAMDAKLSTLQNLVSSLGNGSKNGDPSRGALADAQEAITPSEYGINPRQKLTAADFLPTITDPKLRKSLRAMTSETKKSSKPGSGIPQKLDVPLAKRQQDRIDRGAAFERSKETLNRWTDTVKHNRRAEHLHFPLADPDAMSAKNTTRLLPTAYSKPQTDLESAIQSIMIESGLAPGRSEEDQIQEFEELATNKMPIEEVQARQAELRRNRELLFREEIKSKRIKKIKSRAYRRVHRKERERQAISDREALVEAGVEAPEDEQERVHRLRAEERMGARHRESKWAKGIKGIGRAAWDEDARNGVIEMARREDELKRRIQGRDINAQDSAGSDSASSLDGGSDDEDEDGFTERMRDKLGKLQRDKPDGTQSRLSSMKFMQNAAAAQKARNEEDIDRLRRELANEDSPREDSDKEEASGRQKYGPTKDIDLPQKKKATNTNEFEEKAESEEDANGYEGGDRSATKGNEDEVEIIVNESRGGDQEHSRPTTKRISNKPLQRQANSHTEDALPNPWLVGPKKSSLKKKSSSTEDTVVISTVPELPPATNDPRPQSTKQPHAPHVTDEPRDDSDNDSAASFSGFSPPPQPGSTQSSSLPSNQALIYQAFASDDVLTASSFAAEKASLAAEEEAQPLDSSSSAMPGWGSWIGQGVPKKLRGAGKSSSSYAAAAASSDGTPASKRADRSSARVIISEKKRPAKSARYLASSLPHPFETRAQYERSLRVPVGPEWTTRETFQQATKPRVLVKGGVIAPMRKPML